MQIVLYYTFIVCICVYVCMNVFVNVNVFRTPYTCVCSVAPHAGDIPPQMRETQVPMLQAHSSSIALNPPVLLRSLQLTCNAA